MDAPGRGCRDNHDACADGESGFLPGRRALAKWTPGHTSGHLCFVLPDDEVVFTGDHLLPRISPNIGSYSLRPDDILGTYLDSLHGLADALGESSHAEVLPGHE
ncbi:MBL fold metallo-hydrolase [Streptomyces sp. ITFR-16]|uniref:MBL fold metallo-hydrolase n=1 Tax=Streptomyces sp. ITFR-16 TaxID=3075198 RepID=UPI00288AB980|nr:MBL fold metallo-hydrolase [Streptomyces sp. ITFR-16]WNI21439.1 MBL fold metallo-hydrolase [Streptomyces sp. ITFR-16]